jgi:hypothetical protein
MRGQVFTKRFSRGLVALLCAAGLASCSELYPRFDNILNPDIREPRVGDVVDSVKCAVTAYLHERTRDVLRQAWEDAQKHGCRTDGKSWQFRVVTTVPDAKTEEDVCVLSRPPSRYDTAKDIENKGDDYKPQIAADKCTPYYYAWSYERYQPSRKIKFAHEKAGKGDKPYYESVCAPNGGCPPGTLPRGERCVVDDPSRFALDPNSSATIDLTLTANNTGSMAYTRIDQAQLGWLKNIIAPGNDPPGTPFPNLTVRNKITNVVQMSVVLPQVPYQKEDSPDAATKAEIAKAKKYVSDFTKASDKRDRQKSVFYNLVRPRGRPTFSLEDPLSTDPGSLYAAQALRALREQAGDYQEACSGRQIDYLALKKLIAKLVDEQEQRIYEGKPEVSLEQIVLTASFQLILDASAGTYHIFRIVPVLVPPTLTLNPDHTQQLKITFRGVKNRGSPRNQEALRQRCQTRLQGVRGAASRCNDPDLLMLEAVIETLETTRGGSGGG